MMTNEEISKLSDKDLSEAIEAMIKELQPVFVDYCNNWGDLMPLVVEYMITPSIYANRVTVEDVIYGCEVELDFCEFGRHHECPLKHKEKVTQRALAECLLQVLIEKNRKETL